MSDGREVQERVVGRGMGKAREGRDPLDHCSHLMLWVVSRKLQDILEDFWECLGKLRMPTGPNVGPLGWLLTPLVPDLALLWGVQECWEALG